MNILLVEPDYYTRYPPLGLMKLASYHRSRGDEVKLVRGMKNDINFDPDIIKITSLFTYAWKPVHKAIEYYHNKFQDVKMELGGIYASLMPDHIKSFYPFVKVHVGIFEKAEHYVPAYDILQDVEKWKNWNSSILFTSRGCIRTCSFCAVPKIEGKIRPNITDIEKYIFDGHKKIIIWDNNFFASPDWRNILKQLHEIGMKVDFNQGLDARLIDEEKAKILADLRIPLIRLAYDNIKLKKVITNAVKLLTDCGVKSRNIFFYTLYNFYDPSQHYGDVPADFLERIKDVLNLGCVSYPMRFEPLNSLKKNSYVSPNWTVDRLEIVARARRVLGFGGAFPPYKGLVNKIHNAKDFDVAFSLRTSSNKSPQNPSSPEGVGLPAPLNVPGDIYMS